MHHKTVLAPTLRIYIAQVQWKSFKVMLLHAQCHAFQLPLRGVVCNDLDSLPGDRVWDLVRDLEILPGEGVLDLVPCLEGDGLRDRKDLLHSRTSAVCTPIGSDILCSLMICTVYSSTTKDFCLKNF